MRDYECEGNEMAKILLADANQTSSRKTKEILAAEGHTIVPARSGEDALNILRSDAAIGLVLTDQNLPDTTGFKLIQMMSLDLHLKKIPAIIFLPNVDEKTLRAGLRAGVKDFLAKPFESETLINKVNKALPRRKQVVLLIEYERLICDRLKYIIELKEFQVLVATTAAQGLKILRQMQVEIVIADIGLPEIHGPELIKKIKAEHPRIPVLLITGLSGRLSRDVARASGADGSIGKPFRNIEIIEQLRELTRRSQPPPALRVGPAVHR